MMSGTRTRVKVKSNSEVLSTRSDLKREITDTSDRILDKNYSNEYSLYLVAGLNECTAG